MNKKLIDLVGQRFDRLVVLARDTVEIGARPGKKGQFRWQCRCDCGNICLVRSGELRYGKAKSCGCYNLEIHTKHGHAIRASKSKTYKIWVGMMQRCTNPNGGNWNNYGGRGIVVCNRWLKFENFLADMDRCPSGLSIERVDNEGPYAPWNCIWGTLEQQNSNKRRHPGMKNRPSGLPLGINRHGEKFTAVTTVKRVRYYLGVFETPEKASRAITLRLRSLGVA